MHAPETDALAVGLHEMAALDANEAALAGGRIVEEGDVGRRSCGGAVIDHERLEQIVVPLNLGETRQREQ